jgi:hypothetical protein
MKLTTPPPSADVNVCSCTSTPPYGFMVWFLIKNWNKITFILIDMYDFEIESLIIKKERKH